MNQRSPRKRPPRFGHKARSHDGIGLLERTERLELLVTCLDFPPGKPNGIAFGRMARLKRPGIRVLFVGPADLEKHAEGLGTFLTSPVTVPQVVEGVLRMLDTAPA